MKRFALALAGLLVMAMGAEACPGGQVVEGVRKVGHRLLHPFGHRFVPDQACQVPATVVLPAGIPQPMPGARIASPCPTCQAAHSAPRRLLSATFTRIRNFTPFRGRCCH